MKAVYLLLLTSLLSCQRDKLESIDNNLIPTVEPMQLKMDELSRGFRSMHERYIQVKGRLSYNLNDTALYDNNVFANDDMRIWLTFSKSLDDGILKKLSGQTVVIKGKINSKNKGHLNWYLGTVDNIYFIQGN